MRGVDGAPRSISCSTAGGIAAGRSVSGSSRSEGGGALGKRGEIDCGRMGAESLGMPTLVASSSSSREGELGMPGAGDGARMLEAGSGMRADRAGAGGMLRRASIENAPEGVASPPASVDAGAICGRAKAPAACG